MRYYWYRNLQEKCPRPEWAQNADTHFVRACAVEMHLEILQEPLYIEIYRKNARGQSEPRTQTHTLRKPAQSKCIWRLYKRHFTRTFTGKGGRPRASKTRAKFCASLQNRNAHGDFIRATVCGNLQGKCHAPEWAPWSSTGPYTYRKNPSVWTREQKQQQLQYLQPQLQLQQHQLHLQLNTLSWQVGKIIVWTI